MHISLSLYIYIYIYMHRRAVVCGADAAHGLARPPRGERPGPTYECRQL